VTGVTFWRFASGRGTAIKFFHRLMNEKRAVVGVSERAGTVALKLQSKDIRAAAHCVVT
jgi:hypothetical protein